jgi:hypothetical protein
MSSPVSLELMRLRDLAVFMRSKNAGPFVLTIDIFFASAADCERVISTETLSASKIAKIYKIDEASVRVIHVTQSNALKISIPRPLAAGDVGDRDVAGGQQFAPLLNIPVPAAANT